MSKVFIAGYTGGIWSSLCEFYEDTDNIEVVKISWRWKDDKTNQIYQNHLDTNSLSQSVYFINAIGWGFYGDFENVSKKDLQDSFESNFLVPVSLVQNFISIAKDNLKDLSKINIININSIAAQKIFYGGVAYSSMKAGIDMAFKILQKENTKHWLKVHQVYPSLIDTPMLDKMPYIPKQKATKPKDFIQWQVDPLVRW